MDPVGILWGLGAIALASLIALGVVLVRVFRERRADKPDAWAWWAEDSWSWKD